MGRFELLSLDLLDFGKKVSWVLYSYRTRRYYWHSGWITENAYDIMTADEWASDAPAGRALSEWTTRREAIIEAARLELIDSVLSR